MRAKLQSRDLHSRKPDLPRDIEERIRLRAYEFCEQRGRVDGFDLDDWLKAEAEILRIYNPRIADGIEQNKALKKQMLDRHRPAFGVWLHLAQVLEEAVTKERKMDSAFSRALDLFFIEGFKSHQS